MRVSPVLIEVFKNINHAPALYVYKVKIEDDSLIIINGFGKTYQLKFNELCTIDAVNTRVSNKLLRVMQPSAMENYVKLYRIWQQKQK